MSRGGYREGSGRKSGWNNRETTVIRVPKVFAEQLLQIAQKLDRGEQIEPITKSNSKRIGKVTKSKKRNNSVTQPKIDQLEFDTESKPKDGLSGRELAKELGIDPKTLRYHRDKGNEHLARYTSEKDSKGKVWEYRDDGRYYALPCTSK